MLAHKNDNFIFGPRFILTVTIVNLLGALAALIAYYSYSNFTIVNISSLDLPQRAAIETVSPPAEWIIYENKNAGFSFRHPRDWKITRDLFSEDFILVITNRIYSSQSSGEIRVQIVKDEDSGLDTPGNDDPAENGIVLGYETTFSHITTLAGKEKKESVRFHYLELDRSGNKIPKENWKYFNIYKKMIDSFEFTNK